MVLYCGKSLAPYSARCCKVDVPVLWQMFFPLFFFEKNVPNYFLFFEFIFKLFFLFFEFIFKLFFYFLNLFSNYFFYFLIYLKIIF